MVEDAEIELQLSAAAREVTPMLSVREAEAQRGLLYYREGDGEPPEWWNPDEPMAAEWSASCNKLAMLQVCEQVYDNSVANSVDDSVDDSVVETVDDHIQPTAHPPVGIDPGGIDYNIEPEVIPDYLLDVPLDRYLQEYIHRLCEESGLPFTLVIAVIEQESTYTPWAISESDDYGLMQINAVCHEWLSGELGITDYLNPYQNALAGVYILSGYYEKYGYESGTLMAYNMGEAGANRLFEQGIYSTDYSERVLGIKNRLEAEGR